MTASELLRALNDRGVIVRADGDRLRLSPAEAVPVDLVEELRRCKPEILALLSREPTADDRSAAHDRAVAEANSLYRGGPIDWPAVDAAGERIQNAQTHGELHAAVRHFVAAVADEYGWALGAFPVEPL